jgi:hypothetical protein
MFRSRLATVVVTVTLISLPMLGAAQEDEPKPLTWAFMLKVKPGADLQFEKAFEKNAPDWASIGKIEAAFDTHWEGPSEEEVAQMIADWTEAIEPGGEQTFLKHEVFNANPEAAHKYLRLSAFTVKPGHGGDFMKMYKGFWAPVYEELLKNGVIAGYGMIEQAIHADSAFTHESWITFNDLTSLDAVEQAFEKAYQELSEGEGVALNTTYMKMMKPDTHFDRLIRIWKKSE